MQLKRKMEALRGKLNRLVYTCNADYDEVLQVSRELDQVIYEYYIYMDKKVS